MAAALREILVEKLGKVTGRNDFVTANDGKKVRGDYRKGATSVFVKLNSKWGWKGNTFQADVDSTYNNQKYLALIGLAPEVGGKLGMMIGSQFYYGYFTRIAAVLSSKDENACDDFADELNIDFRITYHDSHIGNFGKDKDGNMVIIDCQYCTDILFEYDYKMRRDNYLV